MVPDVIGHIVIYVGGSYAALCTCYTTLAILARVYMWNSDRRWIKKQQQLRDSEEE